MGYKLLEFVAGSILRVAITCTVFWVVVIGLFITLIHS